MDLRKRITCFALTLTLCLSLLPAVALPVRAVGAKASLQVTNVQTHITLWGKRYATYEINGIRYDSRYTGPRVNQIAFESMGLSDKESISEHFWAFNDRAEQFGEAGAKRLADFSNEHRGCKQAFAVMRDRAERYTGELREVYGGENTLDDPNYYYDKTLSDLMLFDYGTEAQKIVADYSTRREAAVFMEKYGYIKELMASGKVAYNNCVNSWDAAREAATKATANWLINYIVDNLVVPSALAKPSATAAGVDSAMTTVYETLLGYITEIAGLESVSLTAEGTFINVSKSVRDKGLEMKDGAKIVTRMRKLADKNYEMAKYCHDQAVAFHEALIEEAPDILARIERNMEREAFNERARLENIRQKTERARSRVNAAYLGSTLQSAGDAVLMGEGEYSALLAEINSYKAELNNKRNSYEFIWGEGNEEILGYYDLRYGVFYLPVRVASQIGGEMDRLKSYNINFASTLENLAGQVNARVDGYVDQVNASNDPDSTARHNVLAALNDLLDVEEWLYSDAERYRDQNEEVDENYQRSLTATAEYKTRLAERRDEYLKVRADLYLAMDGYYDLAAQRKKLLNETVPDYVRNQGINYEIYGEAKRHVELYVNGGEQLAVSSGTEVSRLIRQARENGRNSVSGGTDAERERQGNRYVSAFFKREANKLEDYYEDFSTLTEAMVSMRGAVKECLNRLGMIYRGAEGEGYLYPDLFTEYDVPANGCDYDADRVACNPILQPPFGELIAGVLTEEEYQTALALKLLLADFKGMNSLNLNCASAYATYRMNKATCKRAVQNGEMTPYEALYDFNKAIMDSVGASTTPTYVGSVMNVGDADEVNFQDLLESEREELIRIAEGTLSYIPVESLSKAGVSLAGDIPDLRLSEGEKEQLRVSVLPINATDRAIFWTSLDPSVAEVDSDGLVTGNGTGTTTIRAVASDAAIDSDTGLYDPSCVVDFVVSVSGSEYSVLAEDDVAGGYVWRNYGTESAPRHVEIEQESGRTTVTVQYKAGAYGLTLLLEVYDSDGRMLTLVTQKNDGYAAGAKSIQAVCPADSVPGRVKVFLVERDWIPHSALLMDESV